MKRVISAVTHCSQLPDTHKNLITHIRVVGRESGYVHTIRKLLLQDLQVKLLVLRGMSMPPPSSFSLCCPAYQPPSAFTKFSVRQRGCFSTTPPHAPCVSIRHTPGVAYGSSSMRQHQLRAINPACVTCCTSHTNTHARTHKSSVALSYHSHRMPVHTCIATQWPFLVPPVVIERHSGMRQACLHHALPEYDGNACKHSWRVGPTCNSMQQHVAAGEMHQLPL